METLAALGILAAAGGTGAAAAAPAAGAALGTTGAGLGAGTAAGLGAGAGGGMLASLVPAAGLGASAVPAASGTAALGAAPALGLGPLGSAAPALGSSLAELGAPGVANAYTAFAPTAIDAMGGLTTPATSGGGFSMSRLMPGNLFPKDKSILENALLAGNVGAMLGGILRGSPTQVGSSPLPGLPREGGGFRPTASAQLEALQQLLLASRRPRSGGFF